MKITERAEKIAPFYVMELLEKAKAMEARGEDIIHMEVGEPDFATPPSIKEEAIRAIRDNRTFYTHSLGLPELREKIAEYYERIEHVRVSPERVLITNGTSGAFLLLFTTLLEKGRILAVSDPGYPCYRNFGTLVDAEILSLPVSESTRFEITVECLGSTDVTPQLLIISNPSNPTGVVYREETIYELYKFISSKGSQLIVDEIYSGLTYGRKAKTSLSISEDVIVVNGFSKAYAMTGWRLGWMVVPPALVRPIQKIAQNVFISPPSISQYAAMYAFDEADELEKMRKTYEERRDFMLPQLKGLGFSIPVDPEGAFYIYAGIDKWGLDSMEFVEKALREARVALTPGYDFGSYKAGSHVRFSYANNMNRLKAGCERLEKWLRIL
ncbi:MAG: pyridoxal phosphate-dependent aminotransferase [Proteobacteria bacterium]|nr:pyridoxal phosphate-dependent aminotransferase [Pseudomonadota bacterium]